MFLKRFAEQVVDDVREAAQNADVLVVAANPRMMGLLRPSLNQSTLNNVKIREYTQDITKLSPREIHAHLTDAGLLPERQDPTQPMRFRQ